MGEGDLPVRTWNAVVDNEGELGACEPENEDRLEPGLAMGGSISCGVEGIEADADGVIGAPLAFDAEAKSCLESG